MKLVVLKLKNYFVLAVLGFSLSNCSSDDGGGAIGSITILTDTDTTRNFEFVSVSEEDASTRTVTNREFRVDFDN